MADNMILATGILSDAAVITGPAGAGDMVLSNLQTQSLQAPYRYIGTGLTITVDLGASNNINCIALLGHNMDLSATVRVQSGAYDSGLLPANTGNARPFAKNMFILYIPAGQAGQTWTITLSAPNNTYIDIGRLYIANAFQPKYNMTWGMQQGFLDASQNNDTISGETITLERKKRRFADLTFQDLSEGEVFGGLYPLDSYVGLKGDVLFVPQPGVNTYLQFNAIYGKIDAMNPNVWNSPDTFSRQYKIKELMP